MASGSELRERVIERAKKDTNFRKLLISNPRAAVRDEVGVDLPSGLKVQVMEETSDQIYLVLPPAGPQGELSDDQLESLSGGVVPAPVMFT